MTEQTPEPNAQSVDLKLVGIGGWLILPAIWFVLGPIIEVVNLIVAFEMYSDVARAGYGGIFRLEFFWSLVLLVFEIYAAILFFGKKSNAPSAIIMLIIVTLVASSVFFVNGLAAGTDVFAIETGKQLVRNIIRAAIWIPYFKVSKRVQATFVN